MRITSVHEEGTIKIPVIELDNEEKKQFKHNLQTYLTSDMDNVNDNLESFQVAVIILD